MKLEPNFKAFFNFIENKSPLNYNKQMKKKQREKKQKLIKKYLYNFYIHSL